MGRRIVKRTSIVTAAGRDLPGGADLASYWSRLKNLIPGEVSAIYIAGLGVIPQEQTIGQAAWLGACFLFVILFMLKETRSVEGQPEKKYPPDMAHVSISAISFIIWAYALGGPFAAWGLYVPWIGTLVMLGWTFAVPYFYEGQPTV